MTAIDSSTLSTQANMALSQGKALPSLGNTGNLQAAKKSAQQFEAVFLSQMFGQMFQGVGTDSLFGGGHGEEMFRSMLIDEYGKQVAKRGGVGIADAVLRTLISQQEKTR
jgi:peptidoglycan hydrolase FlgJ